MSLQQPSSACGPLDGRREIRGRLGSGPAFEDGRPSMALSRPHPPGNGLPCFSGRGIFASKLPHRRRAGGADNDASHGVTVGVDFHWRQDRDLAYAGTMEFSVRPDGTLLVCQHPPAGRVSRQRDFLGDERESPGGIPQGPCVVSRSWLMAALQRAGSAPVLPSPRRGQTITPLHPVRKGRPQRIRRLR